MATYKATYYNINGPMTTLSLSAGTLLGAKREAYARATGEQTRIVLTEDKLEVAERLATDSFHGFAAGARPWRML